MDYLRTSIFATILYYDSFDFPLTLAEIFRYLVNPRRFLLEKNDAIKIKANEVVHELDSMVRVGIIGRKNGFYFLPGKDWLYGARIEKDKLANRKWKKFLRVARYLPVAPYLRAVFASGSLAANNPEPKSDFDIFVVIKSGRLYTGRLFLWFISSILGAKRGRFDVVAPDKLCFNHYVTDDNLELTHQSLYIAQSLANMKPVIVLSGLLDKFAASNRWASAYCYNFELVRNYREVRPGKILLLFSKIGEFCLDNPLGNLAEKTLKFFQQRRIRKNPSTYESGGRIIFTDRELEFHPRSFERAVIDNYNRGLKKFGILSPEEKDSGLLESKGI